MSRPKANDQSTTSAVLEILESTLGDDRGV
jgi:hypothetical protein